MTTPTTSARIRFAPLYEKDAPKTFVFTGCVIRRFSAAFFDAVTFVTLLIALLFVLSLPFPKDDTGVVHMPSFLFVGSVITCFMGYLYLPELFFRQTLGMYLFNVVLVCPSTLPVWASLLIRRGVNAVEFLIIRMGCITL